MPEIQCPVCGKPLQVKTTERGRPSVSCKLAQDGCGFMGFVNAQKGVALWNGKATPAAVVPEKPAAIAAPGIPAPKEKTDEGGKLKWPWEL